MILRISSTICKENLKDGLEVGFEAQLLVSESSAEDRMSNILNNFIIAKAKHILFVLVWQKEVREVYFSTLKPPTW